jgi:selT/selW/selH-like putative selenoprotein
VKGSGGVFEVTADGELIFSKKQAGRFPAPGEVEDALAAIIARPG